MNIVNAIYKYVLYANVYVLYITQAMERNDYIRQTYWISEMNAVAEIVAQVSILFRGTYHVIWFRDKLIYNLI